MTMEDKNKENQLVVLKLAFELNVERGLQTPVECGYDYVTQVSYKMRKYNVFTNDIDADLV